MFLEALLADSDEMADSNQREITITPQKVPGLNRYFRNEYARWVQNMPTPDPFFLYHRPRTIACDYGQNAQILYAPGTQNTLADTLKQLINFQRCKKIGFAIATTIRYVFSLCFLSPSP